MSVKDNDAQSKLAEYRAKRTQGTTPEPFPTGLQRPGQFVVHLHDARRRHWDLRLESGGVLLSWAVPRGPSLDPRDKRLAVQTEDHPVEYLDFEAVIPEGNYGAGPMIVWDRGVWVPREDDQTGADKLLFDLHGHKLRGRWTLVRTGDEEREWLLIKKPDGWARAGEEAALPDRSVYSGLTVEELAAGEGPAPAILERLDELAAPREAVNASSLEPMLAGTADGPFGGPGWWFELKYDGYRLLAAVDGGQPFLRYRRGGEATDLYPEIAPAIAALPCGSAVLDGEVVVLDAGGRPDFGRLARRARLSRDTDIAMAAAANPAVYFAFDLLGFDGRDLRGLPLRERKGLLRRLLPARGPVRYADHVEERGVEMFEEVRKLGLEGLLAKRADAPYRSGRTDRWLKVRADRTADFAVLGATRGKGSRAALGALLLGVHHDGELVYVGRVGTGFRDRELSEIRAELEELRLPEEEQGSPPVRLPRPGTGGHANLPRSEETVWVRPELACEVRFKEVTAEGLLRHPVFLRLRPDTPASECLSSQAALRHAEVFEEPGPPSGPAAPGRSARDGGSAPASGRATSGPAVAAGASTASRRVDVTRPDKPLWPEEGITKGDLIDYYQAVAPWILPYLRDRPLVLDRYPDGIHGKSFFQKQAPHFAPEWIRTATVHSESGERDIDYLVVDDEEALVYVANSAAIPLHVWSSRVGSLDRPDWSILDLDPKEAPFGDVVRVAGCIRELGEEIGLPVFAKTSGKTGLHVLVGLGRRVHYEHSRMLADLLALVVARRLPEIATVNRSLHARGGRVYIDAVQNGAGRLLVAPLCVRPLPGAPVSMPLRWDQVDPGLDPADFTVRTVPELLADGGDPLLPILEVEPDLLAALERLSELQGGSTPG